MRFNCTFEHPKTGETKVVVATLSADDVRGVNLYRDDPDKANLYAMAYALRIAYREVPKGFLHSEPPTVAHLS